MEKTFTIEELRELAKEYMGKEVMLVLHFLNFLNDRDEH